MPLYSDVSFSSTSPRVITTVAEINRLPDDEPDDQAQPGFHRKTGHEKQRDEHSEQRNKWDGRSSEGTIEIGSFIAEYPDPDTNDDESEKCAYVHEIA